jgi:6-pyruvoyl-tetrahydropterin synthase related domain
MLSVTEEASTVAEKSQTKPSIIARPVSAIFLVLVAAVLLHAPSWTGRVTFYTDGVFHHRAVIQIAQAQRLGVVYPRWLPEQRGGLGDPSFMHYSPAFHTFSALLTHVQGNAWVAMRTVMLLSTSLAGLIAFFYLRAEFPPALALAGALAIEANPFPLQQMFQAEFYPSGVAYPLVLLCLIALVRSHENRFPSVKLALAVCLLCLTHILSAFMFVLTVPAAILIHGIPHKAHFATLIRRFTNALAAILAGLALSGFYLVPALLTLKYVSPAGWAFRGTCTPNKTFFFPVIDAKFGLCWFSQQIVFPGLALVALAGVLFYRRHSRNKPENSKIDLLAAVAAISFALGSELSYPLWQFHSPLLKLQFPFRFEVTLGAAAILALTLVALYAWKRSITLPRFRFALAGCLSLQVLVVTVFVFSLVRAPVNPSIPNTLNAGIESGLPEYLPAIAKPGYKTYLREGNFAGECQTKQVGCETVLKTSNRYRFHVEAQHLASVRLPVFAYPAWTTSVDGRAFPTTIDPDTGLVSVHVPAGPHEIELRWQTLPEQKLGTWVSVAGLLALCGFRLLGLIGRRSKISETAPTLVTVPVSS